jgi:hypothetical protein
MILAIPTNDGISIASGLMTAEKIRIMTIVNGVIKEDVNSNIENRAIEKLIALAGSQNRISGENEINLIIKSEDTGENLDALKRYFKILRSNDYLITNALINYLKKDYINESDYLCEP